MNLTKKCSEEQKMEDWAKLFGEPGQHLLQELMIPTYQAFEKWLIILLEKEPLPSSIQGLNFGLFETLGGFELYLSGSNEFSYDDPDWACTNDYWPEGRYAKLSTYDEITERLEQYKMEPWLFVQALTILSVVKFLQDDHTKDIIPENIHIASGFDDGDLFNIDR